MKRVQLIKGSRGENEVEKKHPPSIHSVYLHQNGAKLFVNDKPFKVYNEVQFYFLFIGWAAKLL